MSVRVRANVGCWAVSSAEHILLYGIFRHLSLRESSALNRSAGLLEHTVDSARNAFAKRSIESRSHVSAECFRSSGDSPYVGFAQLVWSRLTSAIPGLVHQLLSTHSTPPLPPSTSANGPQLRSCEGAVLDIETTGQRPWVGLVGHYALPERAPVVEHLFRLCVAASALYFGVCLVSGGSYDAASAERCFVSSRNARSSPAKYPRPSVLSNSAATHTFCGPTSPKDAHCDWAMSVWILSQVPSVLVGRPSSIGESWSPSPELCAGFEMERGQPGGAYSS